MKRKTKANHYAIQRLLFRYMRNNTGKSSNNWRKRHGKPMFRKKGRYASKISDEEET